ncbi:putative MFS family arabinose efflux permease [Panacagrimonas perspica]|uniref:Putative MFS family arabinose efflux permease n=1 Tax=Panacagrimonas perspica TaxID=381431 RepID=A0A4R7PDQ0_9GAMM|nr:MFS transporter [Panacagrimonas perspica]TDU32238.1 putative MFS family arabinose efflux permease [Panacagrimonas perspica]
MAASAAPSAYPRPLIAWCTVGLLTLAYILSFIDRQIMSLLVAPIRRDLGISDTQMSLLMGFSFAVFYTLCGIPLGRLADVASRRWIVTWGVAFWSLATAACGLGHHYWQLFLGRVGVGIGEAALSPAAYSLITDSFGPERRATAISVFATGIFIGTGMAYVLGGLVVGFAAEQGETILPLVGATRPWQLVFYLLGGIGLLFAWVLLLIREPLRHGTPAGASPIPLREVFGTLARHRRTVVLHNFGFAGIALALYSVNAWIPSVWQRVHGWEIRDVGLVYGTIVCFAGGFGIVFGGWLADRWRSQGMSDATLRVGMLGGLIGAPLSLAMAFMPNGTALAVLMIPVTIFIAMPLGVAASAIQDLVPNGMRGQTSAIYLFVVNIVGLGFGPTAVALLTDRVFADDASVHLSLAIVTCAAQLLAFVLLARGRIHYRASLLQIEGRS